MYNAMTGEDDPNQVLILNEGSMTYGPTGDPARIAEYHQRGAGSLPVRKVIDFTALDKVGWMRQLQTYIVTGELGVGAAI
jgi:hypothetical protein